MSKISLGRDEYIFVTQEEGFGSAAYPSGDGFVPHTSSRLRLEETREPRRERTVTRGVPELVRLRREASFEMEGYLTAHEGSAFDGVRTLLESAGLAVDEGGVQATVLDTPAPTTTGFATEPSNAFESGQFVYVNGQIRYVLSSEAGWVEVWPPMSSAPTPNSAAMPVVNMRPATAEAPASFSLFRRGSTEAELATGCVPASLSLEMSGGEPLRFRLEGAAKDVVMWAQAKLDADIDESQTEIAASPIHNIEAGAVISIDDERMKVVSVDYEGGVATVERGWDGTQAQPHTGGADIIPLALNPSGPGKLLYGTSGEVFIDSNRPVLVEFELTYRQGSKLFNQEFGTDTASRAILPERRHVSVRAKILLDSDSAERLLLAKHKRQQKVFVAAYGDGTAFAAYLPAVEFDAPEIVREAEREVLVDLRGAALEKTGADEVFMGLKR